jgi:hypothetical protein
MIVSFHNPTQISYSTTFCVSFTCPLHVPQPGRREAAKLMSPNKTRDKKIFNSNMGLLMLDLLSLPLTSRWVLAWTIWTVRHYILIRFIDVLDQR